MSGRAKVAALAVDDDDPVPVGKRSVGDTGERCRLARAGGAGQENVLGDFVWYCEVEVALGFPVDAQADVSRRVVGAVAGRGSYTQKLWMRVKRKAAYLPG